VWSEKWGSDAVSLVIDALLLNARHSYSDTLNDCRSRQAPHYLRRAENFMFENAAEPIRLEQVAEHAGVSSRTLRNAFVKYRGVPPVRALLNLRLDAVNSELLNSEGQDTVTEIATRWGFRELGRFSVEYRKRFNESPSQTLNRSPKPL
jgi:transcriptional regulator GlxA family with amidase domain